MNRCCLIPALAGLWVALPGPLLAQDELPQEKNHREATAAARAASNEAYDEIERYGKGAPVRPPTGRELLDSARSRLHREGRAAPPVDRRRPPLDPRDAAGELEAFRQSIRERLNALDPDRFPLPEPVRRAWREAAGPLKLEIFDVQDLVFTPEDHVAPAVGLGSNPDRGAVVLPEGGSFSFECDEAEETAGVGVDADLLIELLEQHLGDEDPRGSLEYSSGRLIARKSKAQLERIRKFLARLGDDRGGLVDLEVRLYRMPHRLFAQLRAGATALDDVDEATLARATADGRVTLLSSHRVVAHDGQRVHVRRGGSRSFVADVEVNQTGVIPVVQPVVNVLNEGLVVELRPIVDRQRKVVLIDAALSLSRVDEKVEARKIDGLELELPRMDIARSGSSACVPLGRGALLGGVFKIDTDGKPLTSVVYVRPKLVQGR